MKFEDEVLQSVSKEIRFQEGACGICHLTLKELSEKGGIVISREIPEGIVSQILDNKGRVIGEGTDIVWPPSILKAQINAGLIPEPISNELNAILTDKIDRKRISSMFGYGRCVTPASVAMSLIWKDGGHIEIQREGLAISAALYDSNGRLIEQAASAFCPICAINLSVSRNDELREKVKNELKDVVNTGKLKYEREIENIIQWKKMRVFASIKEGNKIIGTNWGCCIAYAIVRAEIAAGFGNPKWNRLLKNYCDTCPLKHCWIGKPMGALGNVILDRMKDSGVREKVKKNEYITALLYDKDHKVAEGIGTLCSLSATVNAFFRADAIEILKPSSAEGFPYKNKRKSNHSL